MRKLIYLYYLAKNTSFTYREVKTVMKSVHEQLHHPRITNETLGTSSVNMYFWGISHQYDIQDEKNLNTAINDYYKIVR